MWSLIVELWKDYAGTGMMVAVFLTAVIYLLITEKRKDIRVLFVYMPLAVIFIFLCPICAKLIYSLAGDEIYYRVLWLLPMVPVIGYAAVSALQGLKGKAKAVAGIAMACVLMLAGDYVYDNVFFSKAENPYHVPQTVVDICDAIAVEGREVRAAFPVEMLQYVRQYDPTICMPYGREITVERWQSVNYMYDAMIAEKADAELIVSRAREYPCHFIILEEEKEIVGSFEQYGYRVFDRIDGYVIYEDTTVDRGI